MVTQQTQHYLPRVYDDILRKRLAAKGAVLVEGPKWCGKTTTCERAANSVLYMANPVERSQNLLFAETQPSFLLEGTTPRLVDEWQIAPQLWDAVRFEVDQRNSFGQFILTGSSAPISQGAWKKSMSSKICLPGIRIYGQKPPFEQRKLTALQKKCLSSRQKELRHLILLATSHYRLTFGCKLKSRRFPVVAQPLPLTYRWPIGPSAKRLGWAVCLTPQPPRRCRFREGS